MAGPEDATAQEWDLRWQCALAKALGPRRDFILKRRELFRTSESSMLIADGAWLNNEVPPDDASIAVHEPSVILEPSRSNPDPHTWLRWLVARASTLQERLDATQMAPLASDDERLVQTRLRRWVNRVGSEAAFDHCLQLEGWIKAQSGAREVRPNSAEGLRCRVGRAHWARRCSRPATTNCRMCATQPTPSRSNRYFCPLCTSSSAACKQGPATA